MAAKRGPLKAIKRTAKKAKRVIKKAAARKARNKTIRTGPKKR